MITLDRKSKKIVTLNLPLRQNWQNSYFKQELLLWISFFAKIGKNSYFKQELLLWIYV